MRVPGKASGLWMGAFAAALLADVVSACSTPWGNDYCTSAYNYCDGDCCRAKGKNLRRLVDQEMLHEPAAGGTPPSGRQLQDCIPIPPCPAGNILCDDPHMNGLSGQSLEWSGVDGGWYALIQDQDLQINVRLTAPLAKDFPNRQLVTGMSVLSGDDHSFVVEVNNPYSVETSGCHDVSHPCLADGALRIAINGKEPADLLAPVERAHLQDGIVLSTSNLPLECWQFGGSKMWLTKYEEMMSTNRYLATESFERWALKFADYNMAAPDWCAKFISEHGLFDVQSTHAILKIATPLVTVRVNVGINHQGDGELDWDGRVLPDLDFWQMNVGLEGLAVGDSLSGILGETARPVLDDSGDPIMTGMDAIRGNVEDYRVSGALGVDFQLLHQTPDV